MNKLDRIKFLLLITISCQWMGSDYSYNQPSHKSSIIKALSLGAMMMMMEVRGLKWDEIESKCRTSGPGLNYWSKDWSCLASKCTNPRWITLNDLENNMGDLFTCYKETDKLFNIIYLSNSKQCMSQNLYKNTGTTTYMSIDGIIKTSHYTAITNKCTQETCFTDNFSALPLFDQFECAPIKKPAPAGFYWEPTQNTCFYSDGIATTYTVDKNQYKFKGITGIANQPSCVKIFFNDFIPNSDKFPIKPTNPIYWNSDTQKCYFFDGIKLNKNAIFIQEPVDIGYTYVSSNCNANSCTANHMNINPTKDDFLCLNKPKKSLIWDPNKQICLYSDGTNTNIKFIKNNQNGPVVYTYGSYDTTCILKNGLLCSLDKAINIISSDGFLCQEQSPLEMVYKPNCGNNGICYVRNSDNPSITDCNNDSILHSYESSDPSCLSLESCSAAFVNNDIKSINKNNFQCKKPRAEGFYLLTGPKCGHEGVCYYADGKSISDPLSQCEDHEPWYMYTHISSYVYGCNQHNCVNTNPYLLKNKPKGNNFECAQRTNKATNNQNVYYDSQSKLCFFDKLNFYECAYPSGNTYKWTRQGSIVDDNNHPEKYCFSFFSQHTSCNKNTCTFSNLNSRVNFIQQNGFACSDNVDFAAPLVLPKNTSTYFQLVTGLCYFYEKTTDPIKVCSYPTTFGIEGREMPGELVKDNVHPNNECFTATSSLCGSQFCTVDKLSGQGIKSKNFICDGNQLTLDVENVLFENGICFGGYGIRNIDNDCFYPTQFSYGIRQTQSFVNDLKIDSRYGDMVSSNNCYKFKSIHTSCNAETCKKSILKTISQDNFPCFVPKLEACSTECFYENGVKKCEKKECRIFQDGKIYKDPSIQNKDYCEKLNQWTGNEILSDSNTCATFNEKNSASGSIIKSIGVIAMGVCGLMMFVG